ncbi:MAG: adventurous gliding motility protein CglF [Deltaproteobacteria bacterium]|nr:adventurous gliding motility protein CglF [Deltaproteobacteria bacterium]
MLRKALFGLALGGLLFGAGDAAAQAGEGPGVVYKKKTVYDFDDDVVEGELQRPDGEYIDTRRKAKHSSLIKIRENFIPEMLKSAEDI